MKQGKMRKFVLGVAVSNILIFLLAAGPDIQVPWGPILDGTQEDLDKENDMREKPEAYQNFGNRETRQTGIELNSNIKEEEEQKDRLIKEIQEGKIQIKFVPNSIEIISNSETER